jgi:hypothetical protein
MPLGYCDYQCQVSANGEGCMRSEHVFISPDEVVTLSIFHFVSFIFLFVLYHESCPIKAYLTGVHISQQDREPG